MISEEQEEEVMSEVEEEEEVISEKGRERKS